MLNRGDRDGRSSVGRPDLRIAMWASLVPLAFLLHPYAGLMQDARIYIGRGLADGDPAGVGRDIMFALDGQTGFSLMRVLVDGMLGVMAPGAGAMALAFAGALAWLLAAIAVARALATGRAAWAAALFIVALPGFYGAYQVFDYSEVVATPRVFAQAAVLAGLAAASTGRLGLGSALLALALAFHPLMALPGVAVAAALLVGRDRRCLVPAAAVVLGALVAVALGAPVFERLFQPMDDAWLSVLRARSTYLFPTLWPASTFGPILCQGTALIIAAALSAAPVRALLLATLGVGGGGVAASALFGDLAPSTLIVQLQPWRALWLVAVLGNASLALAAVALWRRKGCAYLALSPLILAWLWSDNLALVVPLVTVALCWVAALLLARVPAASPLVVRAFAVAICAVAALTTADAARILLAMARTAGEQGARLEWATMVSVGVQTVPILAFGLVLALSRPIRFSAPVRRGLAFAFVCACALAAALWDGRPADRRAAEAGGAPRSLIEAIGPSEGEVMWVDEDAESWFLAGRPAFFNKVQGAPTLFSRALALDWAGRAALVRGLGWAREAAVSPWGGAPSRLDAIALRPADLEAFCGDPRRPAAVVAPGEQLAAAPPGWTAALWRPAEPVRRLWIDDGALRWTDWRVFTVVRCPPPPAAGGTAQTRDAGSLG